MASHLQSMILLLIVFSATCAGMRELQSQHKRRRTPTAVDLSKMLYSTSQIKQWFDCRTYDKDWTESTWRVGGGTIPSRVSPVRDTRRNCDASWAVATVAAVESATRITLGPDAPVPPLSVQQVLDCAGGYGCGGGWDTDAYAYILKNGGLASEEGYGYKGKNGTCDERRASQVVGGSIMGFEMVSLETEWALKLALCRGPVTAGIASNSSDFATYSGGMFRGACGAEIDHTVLVVGFGEDDDSTKYWKIQNSWGESWGEKGFMRMSFEAGKACKITQKASYPIMTDPW